MPRPRAEPVATRSGGPRSGCSGAAACARPPGSDPHRLAQGHVLAGHDVRLADPAAVERRDDPGRDVIDVGRRDPRLPEADVRRGAVVRGLELRPDPRMIAFARRRSPAGR